MELSDQKRGSWWLVIGVLLLNIFGMGAGYLLLGRWKRALLFAALLSLNLIATALRGGLPYWFFLGWLLFSVFFFVGLLVDGFIMARHGRIANGRPYQKVIFYVLCIGVNIGASNLVAGNLPEQGGGVTFSIPSSSMEPSVVMGDFIVTSGSFRQDWVRRGDAVVFKSKDGSYWIKRVIGLPVETFQMKAGVPYIDGKPLEQMPLGQKQYTSGGKPVEAPLFMEKTPEGRSYDIMMPHKNGVLDNTPTVKIPEGHVFVLGDNRQNSADSRLPEVGPIALADVARKAELIIWSADRSRIGHWVQ